MTRAKRLHAAIERLNARPMVWGVDDCSMWPALWAAAITGRAVDWPAYESEADARAIIAESGGLVAVWEQYAAGALGLRRRQATEPPALGDVGVIATRRMGEAGVIFAEHGIACWRAEVGVRMLAPRVATVVAVWEVPQCLQP